MVYIWAVAIASWVFSSGWNEFSWVPIDELSEFSVFRGDIVGVALMYSSGGGILVISA